MLFRSNVLVDRFNNNKFNFQFAITNKGTNNTRTFDYSSTDEIIAKQDFNSGVVIPFEIPAELMVAGSYTFAIDFWNSDLVYNIHFEFVRVNNGTGSSFTLTIK